MHYRVKKHISQKKQPAKEGWFEIERICSARGASDKIGNDIQIFCMAYDKKKKKKKFATSFQPLSLPKPIMDLHLVIWFSNWETVSGRTKSRLAQKDHPLERDPSIGIYTRASFKNQIK